MPNRTKVRAAHARGVACLTLTLLLLAPPTQAQAPLPAESAVPVQNRFPSLQSAPTLPKLPPLQHEQAHPEWPVADYFDLALRVTGLQPTPQALALRLQSPPGVSPAFVSVPVQTQAFGFSPTFRALAGAELDRLLEAAGIDATRQTESANAYGPYTRRFGEEALERFSTENGKRKLIALYLGHDGIDQMFVTLVVRDGPQRVTAHRTVALPAQANEALDLLSATLPSLIQEVKLPTRPLPRTRRSAGTCSPDTWSLAPPAREAPRGARACHAIALGMLLPSYDASVPRLEATEAQSPAKLAWLAQAYTLATPDALATPSSETIRKMVQASLGFDLKPTSPLPLRVPNDPVLDQIAQLVQLRVTTKQSPARSAKAERTRQLDRLTQSLPPFAAAAFRAYNDYGEAFSQIDLCDLERLLPQTMPRAKCRKEELTAPARPPWPAETLLYQEWRLASHYKDAVRAGMVLGSSTSTAAALAAWPADVAAHPYLRRLRFELAAQMSTPADFAQQLQVARDRALTEVQSLVDLQRADRWLAGHSLDGHLWTGNTNILNDAKVQHLSDHEMRLMSVLRFDRYALDRYMAVRKTGDTAFFLGTPMSVRMASGGLSQLVVSAELPPEVAKILASPPGGERSLFSRPRTMFDGWSDADSMASLAKNPMQLQLRVTLAMGRLQDGSTVADATKLIDAQPQDQRVDHRIGQSHAWATPGHLFYFAGELEPARKYYQKVAEIGTGSESDMMARARLSLLDGKLHEALDATSARVDRYDADYARRDQASILFMLGKRDEGWRVFMSRAMSTDIFQFWVGAYTGHRMEGVELAQIDRWLAASGLNQAQIDGRDSASLYLHAYAVMDRLPSETDLQFLMRRRDSRQYANPLWASSARLTRSALADNGYAEAYRDATATLKRLGRDPSTSFMQPLYAWAAWNATQGRDDYLDEVRKTGTRSGFDEMLAKSMVLALDRQPAEAVRYFTAARYQIASAHDRLLPAAYSLAMAGALMYRKTGDEVYRQETLRFVRAQQKVLPFYGWLYGMEAMLQADKNQRHAAACRANHLDARSYFLSQAHVTGLDAAACREAIASLLR